MSKTSDRIVGSLKFHGYTVQDACRVLCISRRTWTNRMADPDGFSAGEIRMLRHLVDEEVCDDITK